MLSEFIEAYSDDQIYIDMLEDLVNSHPSESIVTESIKYSAYSHLWSVMMVGGIECMIKEWARADSAMHDVYSYFENGSNAERIERLLKAFTLRRIDAKIKHFEDFLAIKYIRNAYIHGEWNQNQREYVEKQGFPRTLMSFEKNHFERMKLSYFHVMQCLGIANTFNTLLARSDI